MKYCLSKKKITELLEIILNDGNSEDKELINSIDLAMNWQAELLILNYLLGIIVLSSKKSSSIDEVLVLLDEIFLLEERLFLTFEGIDENFVDYILNFKCKPKTRLIEDLIELQEDYNSYIYDRTFRY